MTARETNSTNSFPTPLWIRSASVNSTSIGYSGAKTLWSKHWQSRYSVCCVAVWVYLQTSSKAQNGEHHLSDLEMKTSLDPQNKQMNIMQNDQVVTRFNTSLLLSGSSFTNLMNALSCTNATQSS